MQSCSFALCVLITTFTPELLSALPTVTVKLHESATLPCSERCTGVVRWTEFFKSTEVLAECDQTSCRSVKEGYQMIHDQYLKGNFSLTITDADLSKRTRYTCDCDGKDLCDVLLQIEPLATSVQMEPGEDLLLKLDIPDEVEVIYNSTGPAGPSSSQICTVDRRSFQCRPDYTQRVSAALELRGLTPSDSGVYTVMDKRNEEVIHTFTVSVGSASRDDLKGKGAAAVPVWVLVLLVVGLVGVIVLERREIQKLQRRSCEQPMV